MPDIPRDRGAELDAIRETYARYADSGREQIWSNRNAGFRWLRKQRDARLVDLILQSVPLHGTVLDAGCGPGDLAGLIHGRRPDIRWTGIDLLPDSIAAAKTAFPWASWVVGSADSIPVADQSTDAVVAETLFSSLPTAALELDVAREIARIIKPGGWLIWYDLCRDNPQNRAVHGLGAARLAQLFSQWSPDFHTITLAPPIARRLGPLTPVIYPLLHTFPWLRSHLIGRLRRPHDEETP